MPFFSFRAPSARQLHVVRRCCVRRACVACSIVFSFASDTCHHSTNLNHSTPHCSTVVCDSGAALGLSNFYEKMMFCTKRLSYKHKDTANTFTWKLALSTKKTQACHCVASARCKRLQLQLAACSEKFLSSLIV